MLHIIKQLKELYLGVCITSLQGPESTASNEKVLSDQEMLDVLRNTNDANTEELKQQMLAYVNSIDGADKILNKQDNIEWDSNRSLALQNIADYLKNRQQIWEWKEAVLNVIFNGTELDLQNEIEKINISKDTKEHVSKTKGMVRDALSQSIDLTNKDYLINTILPVLEANNMDLSKTNRKNIDKNIVRALQYGLINLWYDISYTTRSGKKLVGGDAVDGDFGGTMERAVKKLQNDLGINVSGVFDKATLSVLKTNLGVEESQEASSKEENLDNAKEKNNTKERTEESLSNIEVSNEDRSVLKNKLAWTESAFSWRTRYNKGSEALLGVSNSLDVRWNGLKTLSTQAKALRDSDLGDIIATIDATADESEKWYVISTVSQYMRKSKDFNNGSIDAWNTQTEELIQKDKQRRKGFNDLLGFNTDSLADSYYKKLSEGNIGKTTTEGIAFDAAATLNVEGSKGSKKWIESVLGNLQMLTVNGEAITVKVTNPAHIEGFINKLAGISMPEDIKKDLIENIKQGNVELHFYKDPDGFDDRIVPLMVNEISPIVDIVEPEDVEDPNTTVREECRGRDLHTVTSTYNPKPGWWVFNDYDTTSVLKERGADRCESGWGSDGGTDNWGQSSSPWNSSWDSSGWGWNWAAWWSSGSR